MSRIEAENYKVTPRPSVSMTSIAKEAPKVAVLIPCYNEEITIADTVKAFQSELPDAEIYVFDNNSTDATVAEAKRAGAVVRRERRQGKGFVVQTMFREVNADVYVMVDGDGTYPPEAVHALLAPVLEGEADMTVGSRLSPASSSEFKQVNRWGNRLVLRVLNSIFKAQLTDILSGYRAFSRKFVKSVPLFGGGFEIETELTIKAVQRGYRIREVPVGLSHRPAGSHSKIRIVRDGLLILNTILALFRDYRPLTFFGVAGLLLIALGLVPGIVVIIEFARTGLVPRLPSAVLAVGLVVTGVLVMVVGLILHTVIRRFQELEHAVRILADDEGWRGSERTGD